MTDTMKNLFLELYTEKYGEAINKDLAEDIVSKMAITDGSERESGEKWNYTQAVDLGNKLSVNWDNIAKCEWYLVLNSMYSDYFRTAKKHGLTDSAFFGELALDWFSDVDGEEDKTFRYFMNI